MGLTHAKRKKINRRQKANGNIQHKAKGKTAVERKLLQEKPAKAEDAEKLPTAKTGNRSYVNSRKPRRQE